MVAISLACDGHAGVTPIPSSAVCWLRAAFQNPPRGVTVIFRRGCFLASFSANDENTNGRMLLLAVGAERLSPQPRQRCAWTRRFCRPARRAARSLRRRQCGEHADMLTCETLPRASTPRNSLRPRVERAILGVSGCCGGGHRPLYTNPRRLVCSGDRCWEQGCQGLHRCRRSPRAAAAGWRREGRTSAGLQEGSRQEESVQENRAWTQPVDVRTLMHNLGEQHCRPRPTHKHHTAATCCRNDISPDIEPGVS